MKRHLATRHKKQFKMIRKYDPNNELSVTEDEEQPTQNDMPSLGNLIYLSLIIRKTEKRQFKGLPFHAALL